MTPREPSEAALAAAALAIAKDRYIPSDDLKSLRKFPPDVRADARHYAKLALRAAYAVDAPTPPASA